jgi:hypothetical protein
VSRNWAVGCYCFLYLQETAAGGPGPGCVGAGFFQAQPLIQHPSGRATSAQQSNLTCRFSGIKVITDPDTSNQKTQSVGAVAFSSSIQLAAVINSTPARCVHGPLRGAPGRLLPSTSAQTFSHRLPADASRLPFPLLLMCARRYITGVSGAYMDTILALNFTFSDNSSQSMSHAGVAWC